jgi:hypothetical protein
VGVGGESPSPRPKKKKRKQRHGSVLMAIAEEKKAPKPQQHHFEKQLEALCPYHEKPVKHKLRDCRLMRSFLASAPQAEATKRRRDDRLDDQRIAANTPPHSRFLSGPQTTFGSPELTPPCLGSRATSELPQAFSDSDTDFNDFVDLLMR